MHMAVIPQVLLNSTRALNRNIKQASIDSTHSSSTQHGSACPHQRHPRPAKLYQQRGWRLQICSSVREVSTRIQVLLSTHVGTPNSIDCEDARQQQGWCVCKRMKRQGSIFAPTGILAVRPVDFQQLLHASAIGMGALINGRV